MHRLLILAAVMAGAVTAQGEPVELNVMSFNIRYGTAGDGENAWPARRELVAETVRHVAPDILGTQETLPFQAEYLEEALESYRRFGMGRDPGGTGERMEVFYRAEILDPLETGNFWLSETPDEQGTSSWNAACNRMVTWAHFYHKPSKQTFYYFNTHFDHRSEDARRESAALLRDRTIAMAGDAPTIVTGDFNAHAGKSVPWQTLTASRFQDAWRAAGHQVGPPVTWSAFAAPKEDVDERIDWILVAGPLQVQECQTVTFNIDGKYPSDHFPVAARLTLFPK